MRLRPLSQLSKQMVLYYITQISENCQVFFCRSGFFCIFAGETLTAFCSGAPARRSHLCDLRHIQKSAETIRNNNFPYRPPRLSSRACIPHCTAAPICSLHTGTGEAAPAVKIRKPSHRSPVVSDCLYVRRPSAIGPAHKNRRDKHLRPLPRQNSCHSRPKPHRCLPAPPLQDEHSHRTSARWYSVLPPSRGTIGQTTRTKNLHTVLASMNILRGPAVPPRGQDME